MIKKEIQEQILLLKNKLKNPQSLHHRDWFRTDLKKLEKKLGYFDLVNQEVRCIEDLQSIIQKYRKEPAYRDFCRFIIPTPNRMGETIYGLISSSFSSRIIFHLKDNKEWIDPETNQRGRYGLEFPILVRNNGYIEESDERLYRDVRNEVFGENIGGEFVKVKSTLSKMVAELECEIFGPFDKEMTDDEKQDFIDYYLDKPEVEQRIYHKMNFTGFDWQDEDLDWNCIPRKTRHEPDYMRDEIDPNQD